LHPLKSLGEGELGLPPSPCGTFLGALSLQGIASKMAQKLSFLISNKGQLRWRISPQQGPPTSGPGWFALRVGVERSEAVRLLCTAFRVFFLLRGVISGPIRAGLPPTSCRKCQPSPISIRHSAEIDHKVLTSSRTLYFMLFRQGFPHSTSTGSHQST
jgi:hypothetical protein